MHRMTLPLPLTLTRAPPPSPPPTEAVALIAAVLMEMVRDGDKSVAELMDLGRSLLGHRQVGTCVDVVVLIYDV